jgi:hypothetical protein
MTVKKSCVARPCVFKEEKSQCSGMYLDVGLRSHWSCVYAYRYVIR